MESCVHAGVSGGFWHVADAHFSPQTSHFFSYLLFCFSVSAQFPPSGSLALSPRLSHASFFLFYPKKPNCNNSGLQTTRGFQTTDLSTVRPPLRYKYLPLSRSSQRRGPLIGPRSARMPLENKSNSVSFCLSSFS